MKIIASAALFVALIVPASAAVASEGARLTLTFEAGTPSGAIMVSLFSSAETYAGGAPVEQAVVNVAKGQGSVTFSDLPAGVYAVKAFHDVDGNGRMTANPFGRPIEPFAFSNNARGTMGPPSWEQASFRVESDTAQAIEIR